MFRPRIQHRTDWPGGPGRRSQRRRARRIRQLVKGIEVGIAAVGVVIDAVNLPPMLGAACGLGLTILAAGLRWLRRTRAARRGGR